MSRRPLLPGVFRASVVAAIAGVLASASWLYGVAGPPEVSVSAVERPPLPRLEPRGTVGLGGVATSRRGTRHPVSETSGIAWIGDERYAAVMDGSDRLLILAVALGDDGTPLSATALDSVSLGAERDWEDLAVVGSGPARRVFAVAEDAPALCEYDVDHERGTCRSVTVWPLTGVFPGMRRNRGPEALAADPDGEALWTANEEALEGDGGPVVDGEGGIVRLVRLPLPGAGASDDRIVSGRQEWVYPVDPPHVRVGIPGDRPYSGVVALAVLSPGRLLVLERSAGLGLPPLENRIFLVDVNGTEGSPAGAAVETMPRVAKTMLWRGSLGVNLEGLCVGPTLGDGGRVVVAIADNGVGAGRDPDGVGADNPLVVFTLTAGARDGAATSP